MRHVDFDPSTLEGDERDWWERWSAKAAAATQAALDSMADGDPPEFDGAIWSELKKWLLDHVFDGKCAYCEIDFTGGYFGDAEHYRPKGKVTVKENGRTRTVEHDGKPHPGYYWLAYDWRNLLPSCKLCNSSGGKMNQFPVARAHVFHPEDGPDPDALNQAEEPLLLHPYRDQPAAHLRFGVKGTVAPRNGSKQGSHSIEVYDLKRGPLEDKRAQRQQAARTEFLAALSDFARHGICIDDSMQAYLGKKAPFSEAVRDYLDLVSSEVIEELKTTFKPR